MFLGNFKIPSGYASLDQGENSSNNIGIMLGAGALGIGAGVGSGAVLLKNLISNKDKKNKEDGEDDIVEIDLTDSEGCDENWEV